MTVGSGRMGGAPPLPSEGVGGGFYKQLDIPSVVAMAVSTEIITLRIVFHFSFFIRSNFLNFNFWIALGRQPPWIPMFRKELCVPRLLCHPCIPCQKWVPVLRCRNLKHRVHRRLLTGDYTEYLKVQRIHRILFATTCILVNSSTQKVIIILDYEFWTARGRLLPWIPMFRKELCVPSAFVPSVYSVSKISSIISVQKF